MLLLPFLFVTNDIMTTLSSRYAQYLQRKPAEYKRKNLPTSASNLDKEDGKDPNCPIPDLGEQILSNADKLDILAKIKKSLKSFYKRVVNAEKQGNQERMLTFRDPNIFNHVLETIAAERICYMSKKNEARLIRIYRLPYKALMGLVNNQYQLVHRNIILEAMYSNPHQGTQERQIAHESETFEPNKLPQPKEYIPK